MKLIGDKENHKRKETNERLSLFKSKSFSNIDMKFTNKHNSLIGWLREVLVV